MLSPPCHMLQRPRRARAYFRGIRGSYRPLCHSSAIAYIGPMQEEQAQSLAEREALSYPFAAPPEPGDALEVAPGVRWLRMRLPMAALNHINLWALEDRAGWTLIDTGMQTEDTVAA